jgi:hypothetical protein
MGIRPAAALIMKTQTSIVAATIVTSLTIAASGCASNGGGKVRFLRFEKNASYIVFSEGHQAAQKAREWERP